MSMKREPIEFKHFSKSYSSQIVKFAEDHIFRRYIFVVNRQMKPGRKRIGYCTYCRKEFPAPDMPHKSERNCPKCGSKCTVIHDWRGHSRMIEKAYFVYYEKSVIDPNVIVARGIYAIKDYTKKFKGVKIQMADKTRYIFEPGNPVMFKRYAWVNDWYGSPKIQTSREFEKASKIYSEFNYFRQKTDVVMSVSIDSIREAVRGTRFQYSTWEHYDCQDMTRFFGLFAKYPCIEYLTKLGLEECVKDKLWERGTYGAINWNAKTMEKVLRLSKGQFNTLKSSGIEIDSYILKLYQISLKEGSKLSPAEIKEIADDFYGCNMQDINLVIKFSTLAKVHSYLKRQLGKARKNDSYGLYYHFHIILRDYRDYLRDCMTLQMSMKSERVLFPKNLYRAHQNTIEQIKLNANKLLDQMIQQRLERLEKLYSFQHCGLLIRPARSTIELIEEGKALNHCVGTYAERYAKGHTTILFIRQIKDPDKPFYTMEIQGESIRQTRGKDNCAPTPEVENFIEYWVNFKLDSSKEKRTRIMIPA